MAKLKSIFIGLYIGLSFWAVLHGVYGLFFGNHQYVWLGVLLSCLPATLFFIFLFAFNIPRTSANLYGWLSLTLAGSLVAMFGFRVESQAPLLAVAYVLGVALLGGGLYVFWYSRFAKRPHELLAVGQSLPEIQLQDNDGHGFSSRELLGRPALLIFYRGNWCPLCMAQIKEIADQYQALAQRGVQILLISPQPEAQTQRLANRFSVPMRFCQDKDNRAAERLGIAAPSGTPAGLQLLGYAADTVMPTVIITDPQGKIVFADLTDNYRVRPEPETFIQALDAAGLGQATWSANDESGYAQPSELHASAAKSDEFIEPALAKDSLKAQGPKADRGQKSPV